MDQKRVWTEEYTIDGASLHTSLRDIIREGKARRIIVKDAEGKTVLKVPLWLGAVAAFRNPKLMLLGAWLSQREPLSIVIEKEDQAPEALAEH